MDKAFVEARKAAYRTRMENQTKQLIEALESTSYVEESERKKYLEALKRGRMTLGECIDLEYMPTWCKIYAPDDKEAEIEEWLKKVEPLITDVTLYHRDFLGYSDSEYQGEYGYYFDHLLDSDAVHFEGDIIITDPCYIIRHQDDSDRPLRRISTYFTFGKLEDYPDYDSKTRSSALFKADHDRFEAEDDAWKESHPEDWDICECGYNMQALGVNNYMFRDTLYGDWSCTTFNKDTKEPIGEFCADAGLVGVFLLDEVLKYNPDFNYHLERPWATTWIKNFKGDVRFIVIRESGIWQDDSDYHKKGEEWEEFCVEVHGEGINTETGEPLNFRTSQTGL